MTLVFLCLGWLAGLFVGLTAAAGVEQAALLQQAEPWLAVLAALAGVAALLGREDRGLVVTALAVALGLLGVWRAFALGPAEDPLAGWSGPAVVGGTISSRPEPRDTTLLLTLDVDELGSGEARRQVRTRVLVRTDRYSDWAYGDRVTASGPLRPVGKAGYWAEHLARQGIHSTLEYPRLQLVERPETTDLRLLIDRVRGRLEELCGRLLPEPQASLLAGILVGGRASMPQDFRDALNRTGTSHIVAVSGFNVTVVAGVTQLVALRFLARGRATLLALVVLWVYSLLTGLPPSAVRAAIMASLALSAILVGRGGDALSFLCLSGALMAGHDPLLLYDLGFQLSFLATAGLVLLEPILRGWLGRLPGWLAAPLSVTLAAQLATLPVLATSFHTLSLVSPLSNLLIAPMLPGLMAAGAAVVALGAAAEPLGQAVAPVAWLYLTYLVEAIRWTARIPGAAVTIGAVGLGTLVLYYLLLLGLAVWPMPEARGARGSLVRLVSRAPRGAAAGGAAAALSLGVLLLSGGPDGKVHVYFLDVGHGDATLIRGPEGHHVLVDGGPSPTAITSALGRRLGFLDRRLDAVVLTGHGNDRVAGLLEVARRHPIGLVLQPEPVVGEAAARAWMELARELNLPVVRAAAGQRIVLGEGAWLEVLLAPSGGSEEDPAPVMRLVAGGVSVLLPGDLSRATQAELARGRSERAEVLRVPLHGAAGALDDGWLRTLSPAAAVVSVQPANRFGHPAESTLALLAGTTVLRTDHHGTVELVIGREGYELLTDR